MSSSLSAALLMAVLGAVSGWFVPVLVRAIPEPEPEPEDAAGEPPAHPRDEADTTAPPEEPDEPEEPEPPKELYADIAALPGLAWKTSLATALVGAVLGWAVGLETPLLFLAYLAPVGVALSLVDWRTRLLPTKVIVPSYAVVAVLGVLAALPDHDWDALRRAAVAGVVARCVFWAMWWIYPKGMGFGDVRLSLLLGAALGYLGWAPFAVGVYASFLVGGLGGGVLALLKVVKRKKYPFGPFMFVGALIGVVWGETVARAYLGG